ncbi:MAG: hypothetical protein ACOZDY_07265 [Pseudomonadota bacterium]
MQEGSKIGVRGTLVAAGFAILWVWPAAVFAEEATGKVVWIDEKSSALLLECVEGGCGKIPSAKPGETFTFTIPAGLKSKAFALKEGQQVSVSYQEVKDQGYALTAIK